MAYYAMIGTFITRRDRTPFINKGPDTDPAPVAAPWAANLALAEAMTSMMGGQDLRG